jgi:hypothetical protein
MTQALYAHMNNKTIKKKKAVLKCLSSESYASGGFSGQFLLI